MYAIDAQDRLAWIGIVAIPHMKSGDAERIINEYSMASQEIVDLNEVDNDFSDLSRLKRVLQ